MSERLQALRLALLCGSLCGVASGQGWTRFRGPGGQGLLPAAEPLPAAFSPADVRWRRAVGKGHSSPVLWQESVLLTQEGEERGRRAVVCFSAESGEQQWAHECAFEPHPQHELNSFASSTPAVDAHGVYVVWSSGRELVALALDHAGEPRWERALGAFTAEHGSGASPIVHGDLLIVANEHDGEDCFLAALDVRSGETKWKIARRRAAGRASYSTPAVCALPDGAPALLFASSVHGLTAVAPASGEILWEIDAGLRARCVATPCVSGDLVLVHAGTGGGGRDCAVVRLRSAGEGPPDVACRVRRNLPYVPSAIAAGGRFLLISEAGFATSLDAASGEVVWRERLDGAFFSSPVGNGKVLWIADREGTLFSLAAGERFEVLGTLALGASVLATPALAADALYVRTARELIRLGPPPR
jgi:outer membrane protein assembly factor BamB